MTTQTIPFRLKNLRLHNFRRFKGSHHCGLHGALIVFAANNGAGKTSILDAIALAFGPFLTTLPKVRGNALVDNDICIYRENDEPFAMVGAEMYGYNESPGNTALNDTSIAWDRFKHINRSNDRFRKAQEALGEYKIHGLTDINRLAKHLIEDEETSSFFPILAYYGTGRGVIDVPQRRRGFGKEFPRFQAYEDCLNPKTNFKKLFEYFYFLEDLERREGADAKDWDYQNTQLAAIRAAIKSFVPEYTRPRTELKPLRFMLDSTRDGLAYDIRFLSDGFKTSLAMVMDIAMRMVEANPERGIDALHAHGIVLIDEIELHLHPSWQQRIIPDLQRTFPNVQFICTTHSPQVLSTVRQESIRLITEEGEILTGEEAGVNSYGAQSYFILEDLMNVSPNPRVPEVENLKGELKKLLERSDLSLDHPDLKKLEQMVGFKDPFIRNLKASIIRKGKERA